MERKTVVSGCRIARPLLASGLLLVAIAACTSAPRESGAPAASDARVRRVQVRAVAATVVAATAVVAREMVTPGSLDFCSSPIEIRPGDRHLVLLRADDDSVVVDYTCSEGRASSDMWLVTSAIAPRAAFTVTEAAEPPCPELLARFSDRARQAVAAHWVRVPSVCKAMRVVPMPYLFPGVEAYAFGASADYQFTPAVAEPALAPSLLVGDSVYVWESVMRDPFNMPDVVDSWRRVRDGPGYRLVARERRDESGGRPIVYLTVFRTTMSPLRVEELVHRSWEDGNPDVETWSVSSDGSLVGSRGGSCRFDESARYVCVNASSVR